MLVVGRRPFRDESAGERGESGGVGGAVRMVWFDPGLLENEEGMELTAEGRWEGDCRSQKAVVGRLNVARARGDARRLPSSVPGRAGTTPMYGEERRR